MSDKMADAPERIWVDQYADQHENPISTEQPGLPEDHVEYVRVDLFATMTAERDALAAKMAKIEADATPPYILGLETALMQAESIRASDGVPITRDLVCTSLRITIAKARAALGDKS